MPPRGPDASNAALPHTWPVTVSVPPVPKCTPGERCTLDGGAGRLHANKSVVVYPSGKLVVARNLDDEALLPDISKLSTLCYRGHHYPVTACKVAPSGAYVVSGDERGTLKVWALDHEDHLCKYDAPGLTGAIRDVAWDGESKKICIGGERVGGDTRSDCARVLQWDTGVGTGQLGQHLKGRVASVDFRQDRPYRIVTAGKDDTRLQFHCGPPFGKIPPENGVPSEHEHAKGAVNCVRFNQSGGLAASVGTDKAIVVYDGKTLGVLGKLENVHTATIYACCWSADGQHVLTSSGDGSCKLFEVSADGKNITEQQVWKVAEAQSGHAVDKVAPFGACLLGCAFVKGDDTPICVGLNGQLCILPKPASGASNITIITGHCAPVAGVVLGPNGQFYTADTDGLVCQWDLPSMKAVRRLEGPEGNADLKFVVHTGAISGLATLTDGTLLTVGWDDRLIVFDAGAKSARPNPLALGAQPTAIATGSKVAVVATVQGLLVIRDGKVGDMVAISYGAKAVAVTKNDKMVYVGGDDRNIHIYDISGHGLSEQHVLQDGHLQPVQVLALSNDESKLASGDTRDVCVFDINNKYEVLIGKGRWCFHTQRVTCLSWSTDDSVLASGGADDNIFLWKVEKKMRRIHYQYAHRGGVTGLAFSGPSEFVSVGADAVVNKWDAAADIQEKFA